MNHATGTDTGDAVNDRRACESLAIGEGGAGLLREIDRQGALCRLCSVNAAGHFAGTRIGAPLSLTKNTKNLAGAVWLAFRLTACTSSGAS